jgi:uncharacterized protein (DUF952 family)
VRPEHSCGPCPWRRGIRRPGRLPAWRDDRSRVPGARGTDRDRDQDRSPIALHLTPVETWGSAPVDRPFAAPSLADEGFIHLTHREPDLVDVANAFYRDDPRPHVVLTVDLRRLSSPWRYDGDMRYPHVYGGLDRAAIIEVRPAVRDDAGTFLRIGEPGPSGDGVERVVGDQAGQR